MNIKLIKNKIEKLGYLSFISTGTLIGGQDNGYDNDLKCRLLKKSFSIEVKDQKIFLEFSTGSLSKEIEFSIENSFLEFLKKEFPLD